VDDQGRPDARYVLCKEVDDQGIIFYTNLDSNKGRQLAHNPHIAATFYWDELSRQVRARGRVEQLTDEKADGYFASRARGSQIGAWASKQSQVLENREKLRERYHQFEERFEGQTVPRPEWWSGFRIAPERIEFWKSSDNRLHDRIVYELKNGRWQISRLYP
jgi:pyridoxamine 5'-phosphate oxidase